MSLRIPTLVISLPGVWLASIMGVAGTVEGIANRSGSSLLVSVPLLACTVIWVWFFVDTVKKK